MVPREVRYVKTVALCHSSCTTNGWRTWCTVAGNHKPYGSRRAHPLLFTISLSLSLSSPLLSIRRLSFSPTTSSASISPGYAFHMAFGWLLLPSPGFSLPPPPPLLSLSLSLCLSIRRPSLYLSIVHNYTIRLLNRLMRPLLPALAAPFTETTTDEHESMCLSLSLLSSPLLFHHSPPLFIPLPFISFRLLAKNSHRLCHSPCFSPPSYSCFHCPPPCQPSRLVEISIFSGACVCTSRGEAHVAAS